MIDIYIINLEHEIYKYNILKKALLKKKFKNIEKIEAVYGKDIKDFNKIKDFFIPYTYYFLPYGALGGCISHYLTLDKIYKKYVTKKNKNIFNEYALILEDDAIPVYSSKYLDNVITKIPNDADIVLINTFEILQNNNNKKEFIKKNNISIHPATAYIVKCSSIPKILEKKMFYYFDITTFNYYDSLNIYTYKKDIFKTTFKESHNLETTYTSDTLYIILILLCKLLKLPNLGFFLLFRAIRIPIINIELNGIQISYLITFIFSCLFYYFLYFFYRKTF